MPGMHEITGPRICETDALPDGSQADVQALPEPLLPPDLPPADPRGDEVLGAEDGARGAAGLPVPFAVLRKGAGGGFSRVRTRPPGAAAARSRQRCGPGTRVVQDDWNE